MQSAINDKIHELRGQRVILAEDIAWLYGIKNKIINRAISRHLDELRDNGLIPLSEMEYRNLKHTHDTHLLDEHPCAFNLSGIILLIKILKHEKLIEMNTDLAMRYFRLLYYMHPSSDMRQTS